jgi:Fe-S oxidoreductase
MALVGYKSLNCRAIGGKRHVVAPAADGCGSTMRWLSASGKGRVREIAESGAATVAVSCPFCMIMLGDGLAAEKPEVRVRDIAEVLADSVLGPEVTA